MVLQRLSAALGRRLFDVGRYAVRAFPKADRLFAGVMAYRAQSSWMLDLQALGIVDRRDPDGWIVDVGANVGQTAHEIRQWAPRPRIACFEPVPATFAELQRRTARLRDVTLFQMGLSDAARRAPMALGELSVCSRIAEAGTGNGAARGQIEVELRTFDEVRKAHLPGPIRLLKIDVEGHEPAVLAGAARSLQAGAIQSVLVEVTTDRSNTYHCQLVDMCERLVAHGFLLFGLYDVPSFVRERTAPFFCNALFVPTALWNGKRLGG
jgi:FkbM family methyltransferase